MAGVGMGMGEERWGRGKRKGLRGKGGSGRGEGEEEGGRLEDVWGGGGKPRGRLCKHVWLVPAALGQCLSIGIKAQQKLTGSEYQVVCDLTLAAAAAAAICLSSICRPCKLVCH